MGVEFTQHTREHRAALEKFLRVLTENRTLLHELFVQPEGRPGANRRCRRLRGSSAAGSSLENLFLPKPFKKRCAGSAPFRLWLRIRKRPRLTPDLRGSPWKACLSLHVLGGKVHIYQCPSGSLWQVLHYSWLLNLKTNPLRDLLGCNSRQPGSLRTQEEGAMMAAFHNWARGNNSIRDASQSQRQLRL